MFVNCHAHSEYSFLDGAGTPLERAQKAKELGQSGLAITDHGNLCGVPGHIQACNQVGIKPIVGIEAYFKPDRHKQTKEFRKCWHLVLLAKNEDGWKNLMKMSTEAHLTGFYHKPCLDWELLEKYGKDLFCSSACVSGYLPWLIGNGDDHGVAECIERHLNIFGKDYRLEIMPHDVPAQQLVNIKLANLSLEYDIPLVATGDSHYPYNDWHDTFDILLMIATGQSKSKRQKKHDAGEDVYEINVPLHMFSEAEMYENFATTHQFLTKQTVEEAINESVRMAEAIEPFELDTSEKMPRVSSSKKESEDLLRSWCEEGMERIDEQNNTVYRERLDHEFSTLQDMGVIDYFVLVGKMVRWARSQGIRISSGRGSAAGSLICYLVRITTIDPIAHELLFERFLNPSRKGLPDIDLDFEAGRRDEVKLQLAKEYGVEKVCDIIAIGTFGARAALKDVARVLDVPFGTINTVTKVIPEAKDVGGSQNIPPLTALHDQHDILKDFSKKHPEVWKQALRVEGHVRGIGKHAAGVVVSDKPIVEYMPLMRGKTGTVTQWSSRADADIISLINMLKIDFLSLDGLTKQGNTLRIIEEQTGNRIDLDDLEIARNPEAAEPEVMKLFEKGHTLNIFQFGGSRGIINFLRNVKPDRFEDLIAINALYRPGPLQGGDAFKYADLKHGKIPIEYWHELVKPFLEKTYGVMVYQEQMQQIAQHLGDFPPSEADDMRKATSKLYRMGSIEAREFMSQYKDLWMQGCDNHGLNEEEAENIWERMIAFGAYSFNRSHAASYSLFAYQDAWLKYHYGSGFYASALTYDDNVEQAIREARSREINILLPDVNESNPEFTVTNDGMRYGLRKIKFVGEVATTDILSKRPFTSFEDFEDRTIKAKCDKRVKDFLVKAGAFDSLGKRDSLSMEEKREQEEEALGISLTGAGASLKYSAIIEERINTEDEIERKREGSGIVLGGEITDIKHHKIKSGQNKGKLMGFGTIAYKENTWDCTFFKNVYEKYRSLLKPGKVVMAQGKKGQRGEVIVDSLIEVHKLAKALEREKQHSLQR